MRRFAMRHFAALAVGLSMGAGTAFSQTPGKTPPTTTPPGRTPPGTTPPGTTPPGTTPPGTTPRGTTPPERPPATRQPIGQSPGSGQNPTGQNPGVGGAGQNPGVTGTVPNRQSPTGSFYPFGMPHHSPLFQYQDVRRDLNINDEQFNKLRQSFEVLNSEFATELDRLRNENRERRDKERDTRDTRDTRDGELRKRYWGQWNSGVNRILTPEQLKRYRQLELQYRGWGALMEPDLQTQLNLSVEQKQRLDRLYNQSLDTYRDIYKMGLTNREAALERYLRWRDRMRTDINEFLTEDQRRSWAAITGDAYRFTPNFGPTDNRPPTNATVPRAPMPNR